MTALSRRLLLERLRADPLLALAFVLVILITSAAVASIPMVLNRVGDDGLTSSLENSLVIQRGIAVNLEAQLPAPGESPLQLLDDRGNAYRENLPTSVEGMIEDTQWVADSARFHHLYENLVVPTPPLQRFFQFRYQSGLDGQIDLISGREPAPAGPIRLSEAAALGPDAEDPMVDRFEVMIGEETAEILELGLGDRFVILADRDDRLNRGAPRDLFERYVAVEITGIFRAREPDSDFWFRETRTYRTDIYSDPDQTIYYSMGVPSEAVLAELLALSEPAFWRYNWRYFVDPHSATIATAGDTAADLRTVVQNLGPYHELHDLQVSQAARQISIRTMLPWLLTSAERQFRLTAAVLSLVVAGILTIGVALSGLLGALVSSRRAPQVALLRSRGASPQQLGLSHVVEGTLLSLPAAALGWLIALLIAGGGPTPWSLAASAAVAFAGILSLWLLTRHSWTIDLGSLLGRRAGPSTGASQRRIVAEAAIVALAVAGIVVLRQRGVTTGAAQQGFDPYLAAVPVLAGIATGIVAVRLYPFLLRQSARFAGRRPDIVPFIGLRRIAEPSLGRHLPLVVMILALGIAVFAGAMWHSVEAPDPALVQQLDEEQLTSPAPGGVNEAFRDGITRGFWLTLFMAVIYAGLAVVSALALTADERRRDVGYLRTLGASRNQAIGLTLIEQVPSALLAGLLGALFGGALIWLIAPGLNIAELYPEDQPVAIRVSWFIATLQALGLVVVAVGAAALFALIARRSDLSQVLRLGE
jgi:hypothetical protein